MKKSLKILIIVASSIVTLLIITAVSISPIVKNYVEKHSRELVGRTMKMDKLSINIFTGGVKIENFVIYEQNDTGKFVAFDMFKTKIRLLPLLSSKCIIQRIQLSGAEVKISQRGDTFNFDDIIAHFAADSTASPESDDTPTQWEIGIYNIAIDSSAILYKDLIVGSDWDINHMNLKIPGVYFSGKSTDVGLNLNFTSGGALRTDLKYDIEKKSYNLKLSLTNFSMEGLLPYLQQSMNINKIAGALDTEITVVGNTDHVMDFDLNGEAKLHNLLIEDNQGRKVIAVAGAQAMVENFNISKENFLFNKISADNVSTDFEVYKDGKNNFSDLMKSGPEQAPTDSTTAADNSMNILIGELSVANSQITYTDLTLIKPFTYKVSDISLTAVNVNPAAHNNTIDISATMQNQGTAKIKWTGNLTGTTNHNIRIILANIDLTQFSPYSLQYFGYPIHDGTLNFTSQNIIINSMLNGTNKLNIYKCELAKKDKQVKPEYSVPLRVGLYILKDKRERIDLDLPIKGNVNSPEFSYKKIVIKALVNVLVKVAAAPVSFLANAMGLGGDKLQSIAINSMQHQFDSEQYAKLHELAVIIKTKPEMTLTLHQELNYTDALADYSLANLKMALYLKNNPDKQEKIELIDIDAMMNTDTKSQELIAYADTLLITKGLPISGNIQSKAVALFSQNAEQQIAEGMMARNTLLYSHMTTKLGLPEKAFTITSQPLDSMKLYKGKSQYTVGMNMGAEVVNLEKTQ